MLMLRLLIFFSWFAPALLHAQVSLPLRADEGLRDLTSEVAVMRDAGGGKTLAEVLSAREAFAPSRQPFSAGYTRAAHWFRITLRREADAPGAWLLSARPAYLDDLRLYSPDPAAKEGYAMQQAGDRFAAAGRPLDRQFGAFTFVLTLPDDQPHVFYLRMQTSSTSALNLTVATPAALAQTHGLRKLLLGLLLGALLMLAANTLMIWHWLRQPAYLLFIGYVAGGALALAATDGLVAQYLFPGLPRVADLAAPLGACFMALFSSAFFSLFFETRRYFPRLHYLFVALIGLALLTLLSLSVDLYVVMAPVLMVAALLTLPCALFVSWRMISLGIFGSRPVFYGYSCYIAAAAINLLAATGLIPAYPITLSSSQIGLLVLLLFLQQGLYQRVRAIEGLQCDAQVRAEVAEALAATEKQRRQEQSTFMTLIAHELKTPLAVIDSAVQTLEFQPDGRDAMVSARYGRIRQSVAHLNGLLENALSVERSDHAPLQPRIERIALEPFVTGIVRRTVPVDRRCSIRMTGDCRCDADRTLLNLASSNLLVNAVKYSPPGTDIALEVGKAARDGRAGTLVAVSNAYVSQIEPDCAQWFMKYYRQHKQPNIDGLGLGLYLVREIARSHGGSAECTATPDQSRWRVTMRLWLPDAMEEEVV